MLSDASEREHELLGAVAYQPNEAVLHTDERSMPRRRAAWASWNYHLTSEPARRTQLTYWMNNLQSLASDTNFLVTLNRTEAIAPGEDHPHDPLRASCLHARGLWPHRRAMERSRASTAPTTAAPTGAGGSTRTEW